MQRTLGGAMGTTLKILTAGAVMGAALSGGIVTANAQYYPPPPYGYGGAGPPGTGARRVTPCRAATVRRIGVPGVAGGILGTAVHRATRCKAATVHLIEVPSVAHLADGTVIKRCGRKGERFAVPRAEEMLKYCRGNFVL
jgi:hypothetical protein